MKWALWTATIVSIPLLTFPWWSKFVLARRVTMLSSLKVALFFLQIALQAPDTRPFGFTSPR